MGKRSTTPIVLAWMLCFFFATLTRADELYRINLSPPDHIGQKFEFHANETETSETRRQRGEDVRIMVQRQSTVDLGAGVEVQGCDQRGMPSQLKLTIRHLWYLLPVPVLTGDPAVVPSGTEFSARSVQIPADPPVFNDLFEMNEGTFHPFAQQSLRRVVSIGGPNEASEQQAFGTDKLLPIGGSWSLNGEPGQRLLAKLHIKADPAQVYGMAKLVGVSKHNDADCLEVHMTVNCDHCSADAPPGGKIEEAIAECDLTYYLDRRTGRVVEAMYHARTNLQLRVPDGAEFYVDRTTSETTRKNQISGDSRGAGAEH